MEALASGFQLAEAPCAAEDGSVYFSNVLGGGVHRWSPDGGVETVIPKRRGVGGMCLHADGGLVVSGRDLVHVRDGETRELFSLEGATGFNDIATDSEGRLYAGALRFMPFGGEEPVPGEIWRVDAAGSAAEILRDVVWPNGIGFSPDGGTLYACDFAPGEVIACDLESGHRSVLARSPSGDADGLAVDVEGGIWVALGSGGIGRFAPDGDLEEVLEVPAEFVSSLCFGSADRRDLFITTGDALFRTQAPVEGLPVPPARI